MGLHIWYEEKWSSAVRGAFETPWINMLLPELKLSISP